MFVAIENNEMTVPQVLDWINRTKNANNNVISPEFAMEILGKTNFYGHIKAVLKNIKERCKTKEDILPYKEFILSCVDRREMSEQAMVDLQKLAKLSGCEEEFDEVKDKPKCYFKDDCYKVIVIKSKEELEALEGEDLRVFFDADEVDLSSCWLKRVKSLKFRKGVKVDLSYAYNLPKDLDVSMCSVVNLSCCDLDGLKLKFKEGAKVDLRCAYNFPKDLDLSMCSNVDLSRCDLDGLKLKFREGARVDFSCAENLPEDLDVSMCSVVDLGCCNLEGLDLKFREGAEVYLSNAYNFPKDLDVSMCSVVDLSYCYLNGVEKIKFKDKVQEAEAMRHAMRSSEKVEYVGDEKSIGLVNGNSGMEM